MKDLREKRFGMLKVMEFSHRKNNSGHYKYYWICECDCGNVVTRRADELKDKEAVVSCGCYRKKILEQHNFKINNPKKTHGCTGTRLYKIYRKMKERCYNPNYPEYHFYGGRGIKICQEWFETFENFRDWALTNGYNDELSIDRIEIGRAHV